MLSYEKLFQIFYNKAEIHYKLTNVYPFCSLNLLELKI